MTIRQELEILGVERVKSAMIAFEHRLLRREACFHDGEICCFLGHTGLGLRDAKEHITGKSYGVPEVESYFEGFGGCDSNMLSSREELRQECILFLAEHGVAIENSIASEEKEPTRHLHESHRYARSVIG